MASGRPVVASDVAAIATAVRDGDTGRARAARATRARSPRAITELVADPTAAPRSARGPARVVERDFDLARCTAAFCATLEAASCLSRTVAYVLKGYPRLSELFIASEIQRLEQLGVPLRLFVLKPPDEDAPPPGRRPDRAPARRTCRRPRRCRRSRLPPWLRPTLGRSCPALRARRPPSPARPARAAAAAAAQSVRARDGLAAAHDLRQGAAAGRRARRPRSTAPATCATCTPTSPTARRRSPGWPSMITGLPFSFTGHAKDIYRESLNPAGLLRAQAARRRVRGHLHRRQPRRTCARLAPDADVHLVYHGLNADFARLLGDRRRPADRRPAAARRQRRPAGRRRRASTCCVDAVADAARARASTLDAGHRRRGRRRRAARSGRCVADARAATTSSSCRAAEPGRAARAATAARTCSRSPAGSSTTATATASPTCSSRRWPPGSRSCRPPCPGIPELVRDGENGLLVPPDDPGALWPTRCCGIAKDPALRAAARGGRAGDRRASASTATRSPAGWPACSRATP